MDAGPRAEKVIRVYDLREATSRAYGPFPGAGDGFDGGISDVAFAGPERLLAAVRGTGLVSVDLKSGDTRVLIRGPVARFVLSPDGSFGIGGRRLNPDTGPGDAIRFSLDGGEPQVLQHGADVRATAMDSSGTLVATGSRDGTIRVSRPTADAAPHLLLGQEGAIYSLAFSPDGRWLAASGEAFDIRVWPVPDVSRRPFHLLPHDAMLNLLRSHTNLRAVRDAAAPGGYALRPDAFPGWGKAPEW
jgi:WD40 repeat protein